MAINEVLRGAKRERVLDVAVEQLRTAIENGDLSAGEKLPPIDELCEIMNMGRSSIREAFRILEVEGLIEIKQGTGTFVTPRDSWFSSRSSVVQLIKRRGESLLQVLEIRQCLERMLAGKAAELRPPSLISELSEVVNQLSALADENHDEMDLTEVATLNNNFHLAISRASGNIIAHEIILHILPPFAESNKALLFAGQSLKKQAEEHTAIFEAIKSGNSDLAKELVKKHLERVIEEIRNLQRE